MFGINLTPEPDPTSNSVGMLFLYTADGIIGQWSKVHPSWCNKSTAKQTVTSP